MNKVRFLNYLARFFTLASLFYFAIILPSLTNASQELPQSFSLDGRAYSDTNATVPLLDTISTKLQILNSAQDCILYEETQSIVTTSSNGYFTVQVGSATGDAKRSALDSANTMSTVYANSGSISGKKVSDGSACTYNPTSGDKRYLRILMTPAGDSITRTLSPNASLDAVPYAIQAERCENIQGVTLANLIQTSTTSGAAMPSYAGNPASPGSGQVWYDSTAGQLKYYDGSVRTLASTTGTSQAFMPGGNAAGANTSIGTTDNYSLAFKTNNTTAMTIDTSRNVGIGTTSPNSRLHIATGSGGTPVVLNISSNATAAGEGPQLGFENTGSIRMGGISSIWEAAAGNDASMAFTTRNSGGLSEKLRITSLGYLGVGTSTPAGILDVQGGTASSGSGTNISLVAQNAAAGGAQGGSIFLTPGSGTSGWPGGRVKITTQGNTALSATRDDSTVYTSTSAASAIPHISLSTDNTWSFDGSSAMLSFTSRNASTNDQSAYIGVTTNTGAGVYTPDIVIGQQTGATAYTERMRINSSGYVGIGTTSPSSPLQITHGSSGQALHIYNTLGTTNSYSEIGFRSSAAASVPLATIRATRTDRAISGDTNIGFFTYGGGSVAERVTIRDDGKIGIGTTSPGSNLEIYNAGNAVGILLHGGSGTNLTLSSGSGGTANTITTANGSLALMGGNVGVGTTSPSEVLHVVGNLRVQGSTDCTLGNGAGGTNCSSDVRLKENIKPIDNSLEKISQLRGIAFDWNAQSQSPGKHSIGVIAQEVEQQFPTAVIDDPNSGYKKVDYAVLVAPLIEAVKELKTKIEVLQTENKQLKSENKEILKRVEALERNQK